MTIAFTLCSNNYLAHAKTMADSYLQYHSNHKVIIGLVDTFNDSIDYSIFTPHEIIPVAKLNIPEFNELNQKYNITELNTAVKPTYFHYIFDKYQPDNVVYIDPDILVTSTFTEVFEILLSKNIIITPHICSPIDDEYAPTDYHTLRGGVFNLGFIALSNYSNIKPFLNWWHDRVVKYGFADFTRNMFYDQLWINYVPAFYENYHILRHLGYNMANWNLHERLLSMSDNGKYYVNNTLPLRFFHFSSFSYKRPDVICSYLSRYTFETRQDLLPIFKQYTELLKQNQVDFIRELDVAYYPSLNKVIPAKSNERFFNRVKKAIKILLKG